MIFNSQFQLHAKGGPPESPQPHAGLQKESRSKRKERHSSLVFTQPCTSVVINNSNQESRMSDDILDSIIEKNQTSLLDYNTGRSFYQIREKNDHLKRAAIRDKNRSLLDIHSSRSRQNYLHKVGAGRESIQSINDQRNRLKLTNIGFPYRHTALNFEKHSGSPLKPVHMMSQAKKPHAFSTSYSPEKPGSDYHGGTVTPRHLRAFGGTNKFQKAMHVAGKNSQSLLFPNINQSQQFPKAKAGDLQVRLPRVVGLIPHPQPEQEEQPRLGQRQPQDKQQGKLRTPLFGGENQKEAGTTSAGRRGEARKLTNIEIFQGGGVRVNYGVQKEQGAARSPKELVDVRTGTTQQEGRQSDRDKAQPGEGGEEGRSDQQSMPLSPSGRHSEKFLLEQHDQGRLSQAYLHQSKHVAGQDQVDQVELDDDAGHSVNLQEVDSTLREGLQLQSEQKYVDEEQRQGSPAAYAWNTSSQEARPSLVQAPSGDSFKIQEQLTLKNYVGAGLGQSQHVSAAQKSGKNIYIGSSTKSKESLKSIRYQEANRRWNDEAYRAFSRSAMDENRPTLHKDQNQKTHSIIAQPPNLQKHHDILDLEEMGGRAHEQMESSPLTDRHENLNRFLDNSLIAIHFEYTQKKQMEREPMPNTLVDSLFDSKDTELSLGKVQKSFRRPNNQSKVKIGAAASQARIERLRKAILQGSLDQFQQLSTQPSSIENVAQKLKPIVLKDFEGNFLESASKANVSPRPAASDAQQQAPGDRIFIGGLVPEQFKKKEYTGKLYEKMSVWQRDNSPVKNERHHEEISLRLSDIVGRASPERDQLGANDDQTFLLDSYEKAFTQQEMQMLTELIEKSKAKNGLLLRKTVNQISHTMGKIVHQSQATKRIEYLPEKVYQASRSGPAENRIAVNQLEARFIRIPLDVYEELPEETSAKQRIKVSGEVPLYIYFVKDAEHFRIHLNPNGDDGYHDKSDLRVYASTTEMYPSEDNHDFFVQSLGSGELALMVVDQKSSAAMFSQKSLYLGLYSLKGLEHLAFIFGFGRSRQAHTKRLLVQEFKQKSEFEDYKDKLLSEQKNEPQPVDESEKDGKSKSKIELPIFITNANKNRHRMSLLSAKKEFKEEVGGHVGKFLNGPVNDVKTLAYLENWRRLKKVVNKRNDHQKKKLALLRSNSIIDALAGSFEPSMCSREDGNSMLYKVQSTSPSRSRFKMSAAERAEFIKDSVQESTYKLRLVQAFKLRLLKRMKDQFEESRLLHQHQQKFFKRWVVLMIGHGKVIFTAKNNFDTRKALFSQMVRRLIGGRRMLRILRSKIIPKLGPDYRTRQEKRIQNTFKFLASTMLKTMIVPNCKKMIQHFLFDKNRLFQLELKIRIFYTRMVNIQKKYRAYFTGQIDKRRDIALCILDYRNRLRDIICINKFLYKKYQWVVDEVITLDFDPEHQDAPLARLIRDVIAEKSLRFQVNVFRWHALYGETQLETNLAYILNLVRRLQEILERHHKLFGKKKLNRYAQAAHRIEQQVRQRLKMKSFGKNISGVLQKKENQYQAVDPNESKKKLKFANLGQKLRMRMQQKRLAQADSSDEDAEHLAKKTRTKLQVELDRALIDGAICKEIEIRGLMKAQKLDSLLPPTQAELLVVDENYDFRLLLWKALYLTKIENARKAREEEEAELLAAQALLPPVQLPPQPESQIES